MKRLVNDSKVSRGLLLHNFPTFQFLTKLALLSQPRKMKTWSQLKKSSKIQ